MSPAADTSPASIPHPAPVRAQPNARPSPRDQRHLTRLAWLHLVPWAAVIAWRMIEITPRTSSAQGSGFVSSTPGRALVLASVIVAVLALLALLAHTWLARRRAVTWILFLAFVGAFARRETLDAFDVAWFVIVPSACAWVLLVATPSRP